MASYIGVLDGEGGAYGIHFPDLPGCVAMGDDFDAAFANAIEALRLWVEDSRADGEVAPPARDVETLRRCADVADELKAGSTLVVVPLLLDSGRPARANISVDAGLLEAIDTAARDRGLSRSAFLVSAAREKIARGA